MGNHVIVEYVGTFILIFAGAATTIVNQKTEGSETLLGLASATCLAVMVVSLSIGHFSGAHLNPSITTAFATLKHFPWVHVHANIAAQDLASFSAAFVLKGVFHPIMGGGVTVPAPGYNYAQAFALEFVITFILMFVVTAVATDTKANEALIGGGTLFVNKHPNLGVRVVHGNTLTYAVIIHEISNEVKEVFLTGATSKLGRAIAYLSIRKVRVLMITLSTERFQKIQKEAPEDCPEYFVQVTKYNAARSCKTWIVGKWITPKEQSWAPRGTHFHQFVVPPVLHFRRDCTHGDLAAMKLTEDVQGLSVCEYTIERGVVHACHTGGVVHFLEGWNHHEVRPIDVERINVVWEASLKHGLKTVSR